MSSSGWGCKSKKLINQLFFLGCHPMMRIVVRAYSCIEASTNRWCSAVLCTRQFCSTVPCSGSRVSGLADYQSRITLNIILLADLTGFCDWRSANPLTRDPLHGTVEQNWRVRKTAEHQRLVEASIREYARTAIRVMGRHPHPYTRLWLVNFLLLQSHPLLLLLIVDHA